ncbi:MAG: HTTM domain-containing protein [Paracoccaceae bacterium]
MTLDIAIRWTEVLLAFAILQQSIEHLTAGRSERNLVALRIPVAAVLLCGFASAYAVWILMGLSVLSLRRFDGPYNGGADKMSLLILTCLSLAHIAPTRFWAEMALSYLAIQVVLSYFVSGWVKLRNPDWRNGTALRDVFGFSAYPATENLRRLSDAPLLTFAASWVVIAIEVTFPLALASSVVLLAALAATAVFHLANVVVFGLNRFLWAWLAAYPSLIWFQMRVVSPAF